MSDQIPIEEFNTTPEESRHNKKQLWLTLVVMLVSFCVGALLLLFLLWLVFEKILPPGWLQQSTGS
jgi:uncharacterized membrane protein